MCKRLLTLLTFVVVLGLLGTNVVLGDTIEVRIATELDDAEEDINPSKLGDADEGSSDLEMPYEDTGMGDPQFIGVRYQVDIPAGKSIWNAWVRFQVDEADSELPTATRLFLVFAFNVGHFFGDRFQVGHFRGMEYRFDAEFSLHFGQGDFDVDLPCAGDEHFVSA